MADDGTFVVAWEAPSTTDAAILAQRFQFVGAPRVTKVTIDQPSGNDVPYDVPAGANQLRTVPVGNAEKIKILFDQPVSVAQDDLALEFLDRLGNPASVSVTAFSINSIENSATWTVNLNPGVAYQVTLTLESGSNGVHAGASELDGEWTNPDYVGHSVSQAFPSGDGSPGGDFEFKFTLLPGDGNLDNKVDPADYTIVALAGSTFVTGNFNGTGTSDFGGNFTIWSDNYGINWSTMSYIEPQSSPQTTRVSVVASHDRTARPVALDTPTSASRVAISHSPRRSERERIFDEFGSPDRRGPWILEEL